MRAPSGPISKRATLAESLRHGAVATGAGGEGADQARLGRMAPPAAAALQDCGALVFSDHALDLQL